MTTALLIGQFGNYADIVWSDDFTVVSVPPSLGGWTNDPGWRRGAYNWIPHVPGNTNEQGSWSSADFGDSSFRDHNPGADVPFTIVDDVDAENGKAIRIAAWIEGTDGQGDPIWRSGLLSARDTRNALSTDRAPASSISRVNGYFECRMKLPTGLGLWPAFWLLSEKNEDGYTVEVDVIEHYGHVPDEFKIRLHSWNSGIASVGEDVTIAGLQGVYRTFGVDCRSTEYVFYADGEEVWRTPRPEYHRTMPLSPIVNLALGPGWPIDQTPDPSYLYVDYVRVWERRPMSVEVQPELWSPIGTAPLVALFDAREGVLDDAGDPALDGSEPAQWLDLSGNDYHLSKADVTRRLTWTASDSRANGLPTMGRPDDNDRHSLDMTTPATIGSYYGVIVYRDGTRSTFVSYPVLLNDTTNNSQSGRRLIGHQNQSTLFDAAYSINTVASVNGRAETESILPLPLSVVHAREKNGQQMTGLWSIGGAEYFTSRVWGGGAFMVMLTDGTEDQAWIDRAVGWMAHEAGIAASLDAGHPYREQPPMLVEVQPEPWSPIGKPWLVGMYDANAGVLDGAGAPIVNGGAVGTWEDQSGNGWHATQPDASRRLTYTAADTRLGGHPSLGNPDRTGQHYVRTVDASSPARIYFGVVFGTGVETATTGYSMLFMGDQGFDGLPRLHLNPNSNSTNLLSSRRDGAAPSTTLLPLPAAVVRVDLPSSDAVRYSWLGDHLFSGQSWFGAAALVLTTDGTEDDADADRLVGFIAHKIGSQTALDAGHPYREQPPMLVEVQPEPWSPVGKPYINSMLLADGDVRTIGGATAVDGDLIEHVEDYSGAGNHGTQGVSFGFRTWRASEPHHGGSPAFVETPGETRGWFDLPEMTVGRFYLVASYGDGSETVFTPSHRVIALGGKTVRGVANGSVLQLADQFEVRINGGVTQTDVLPLPFSVVEIEVLQSYTAAVDVLGGLINQSWPSATALIVSTGDESPEDRDRVVGWLAHRYGIALVPGHPYRDSPP